MLIDTHLHLIDKNALSYPWLESAPALNRDSFSTAIVFRPSVPALAALFT
ncbi:hypothetical protein C038_00152 [Brucella sp. 63/311]|nr:hypothetical protein C038_00152 [Brucella sp. 63/311]